MVASGATAIPLPYFKSVKATDQASNEVSQEDDKDDLFMGENAPLFMKLRESERNRRSKMKAAATEALKTDGEKDMNSAEGFFGPGLNPFSFPHDKELNEDFLMTDFENLLKRKP